MARVSSPSTRLAPISIGGDPTGGRASWVASTVVTRPAPAAPDHAAPPQDAVTLLGQTARRHPDAEAFVEASGERITFAQWDAAADGVAAALAERGVVAGDVVCLLLASSIRYMVCYQAAMRLGAVTSGVNLRLGPTETTYILERSTPRVTVVEDPAAAGLPPSAGGVVGWGELEGWTASPPPPLAALGPGSPVAICWTGGTTGRPKGALFDQANLAGGGRGLGRPLGALRPPALSACPSPTWAP